jgi:hypothetical protein
MFLFTLLGQHFLITIYRKDEHAHFESMARNRISNISFAICSAGEIVILAIMVGILKRLKSNDSTENNTKAFSVIIAFSGGVWRAWFDWQLRIDCISDVNLT